MKIRQCFISNSSSTSFIITSKNVLTEDVLLELSKVDEDSIFYDIIKQMVNVIVDNINELKTENDIYNNFGEHDSLDEFVKCNEYLTMPILNFKNKNHHLYIGSFSNESDSLEAGLSYSKIYTNIEDFYFSTDYY